MGSILKAKCNNCGYETGRLLYGGGFVNFRTTCKFPVLNKAEREVQMANIMDRDNGMKHNPNLLFYDDETLSDEQIQDQSMFHEWGIYKVYHNGYLCPKCMQFTLSFYNAGCWD